MENMAGVLVIHVGYILRYLANKYNPTKEIAEYPVKNLPKSKTQP